MPANNYPITVLTANIGTARITAANTARDGSGANIITCFTAGTNGSRIERITVIESDAAASSTAVAQVVRFWLHDGTNFRLYKELLMTSIAGSNTAVSSTNNYYIPGGLFIPSGWTLRCASTLGSTTTGQLDVVVEGADY